jgi:eukaryotic-like serine/threonine-protein kinase
MSAIESESSLLFGMLALQNGLVEQPDLIAAFQYWCKDRSRAIAQFLVEQGALSESDRAKIDGLIRRLAQIQANAAEGTAGIAAAARDVAALPADPPYSDRDRDELLASLLARGADDPLAPSDLTIGVGPARGRGSALGPSHKLGQATSREGRFQLLRHHASGGIGVVYVARDSELNREVALKQIQVQHADDPASRARFLVEAEVTGRLEHPGIVPVYGLGTNDQGRPFYAMRFVRGQSLKEAIDRYHQGRPPRGADPADDTLALRQLLSRFVDVCHAIAYSHSRGIIHRDLKPANILLGHYGETLVVDWGLAKVVGGDDPTPQSDAETTLRPALPTGGTETRVGVTIGTPAYMSPEQSEGRAAAVGPASDVYSLGATLYCIVTGRPPLADSDLENMLVRLRRGAIDPPRQVNHAVPAPLEAIVMKAMALRPDDRYTAAQALGQDVERWLADEPVLARREPLFERARRWMRRHRTAVAAIAAALVAATLGLTAVLIVQREANSKLRTANLDLALAIQNSEGVNRALEAANNRERARFELALDAIKTFHGQVSEDLLLRERQFDGLRTRLLHGASAFYQRLEGLLKVQADQRSRAALGQAYHDIGELTAKIGSQTEALAALKRGLELRLSLAAEPAASQQAIRDASASLIAVGDAHEQTGDLTGAMASYEQAQNLLEDLLESNAGSADDRAAISKCLHGIASVQYHRGHASQALASHEQALALRQQLVKATPDATRVQSDLAQSYHDIGEIHRARGRAAEAISAYEQARAIRQKLTENDPFATQSQRDLAQSYIDIGYMYQEAGRFAAALESFVQAKAILQKLADAYPAVSRFEGDLAQSDQGIGSIQHLTGHFALALASFERARTVLQKLADANPTLTIFQTRLATNHSQLGMARFQAGRPADAAAELRKAVAIMERLSNLQPSGYELYNLACFRSLLSGIARDPGSGMTADDVRGLGEQAVATLRRAVAAGLEDVAFMRKDPDLEPLRSRPDFQMLLMDLAFPTDPFAN